MTNNEEELPLCECGCGLRVTKKGNRFIVGHNGRGKHHTDATKKKMSDAKIGIPKSLDHCAAISDTKSGVSFTPEHCAAISAAAKGKSKSPEHCTAISAGKMGISLSPDHRAAVSKGVEKWAEMQRGGHDIVKHHYIYDHANPEKYTMKVTRSKHIKIHWWMKKSGIKVPHINVTEENKNVFGEYKDEQ